MSEEVPKPITVKGSATPVVLSESTKVVLIAAFAYAASHFVRSEIALAAIIPAAGILATWLWGVWHRVRTWGALRFLASIVHDDLAVVSRRK